MPCASAAARVKPPKTTMPPMIAFLRPSVSPRLANSSAPTMKPTMAPPNTVPNAALLECQAWIIAGAA